MATSITLPSTSTITTLSDGGLINTTANFYRSTKPLTRVNGSPLVIGDVWVNPSMGVQGYWNGTYWLSFSPVYGFVNVYPLSHTGTQIIRLNNAPLFQEASFLERILFYYATTAGPLNASNFYTFTFASSGNEGQSSNTISGSFVMNSDLNPNGLQGEVVFNTVLVASTKPVTGVNLISTATGTPNAIKFSPVAVYRKIL